MTRHEYTREPIPSGLLEETLNALGEEGWRPIHFEGYRGSGSYVVIFEREHHPAPRKWSCDGQMDPEDCIDSGICGIDGPQCKGMK